MSNMLVNKKDKNTYVIKMLTPIDIYNPLSIEDTTRKIIDKIKRENKLRKEIVLDIYPFKYETIIILNDYNKFIDLTGITDVKINIHTDATLLYEIDFLNIRETRYKGSVYYYDKRFYFKPYLDDEKDYINLSELSNVVYENVNKILDNGLKIKI